MKDEWTVKMWFFFYALLEAYLKQQENDSFQKALNMLSYLWNLLEFNIS